jgi:hypothetical protein
VWRRAGLLGPGRALALGRSARSAPARRLLLRSLARLI